MAFWTKKQFENFENNSIKNSHNSYSIKNPTQDEINKILERHELTGPNTYYIPGEVPSSKNFKRIAFKPDKTNKSSWKYLQHGKWIHVIPFIVASNFTEVYKKYVGPYYQKYAFDFRNASIKKGFPVYVEFTFIRKTNQIWDFNNITQVVQDLMKEYGWIDDDNSRFLIPMPPQKPKPAYHVDKENPGVIIRLL
jgi:hypothetical protein